MNQAFLEFKLRCHIKQFGEFTYRECVDAALDCEKYLEHMPVDDIAWKTFTMQRRELWKYAEILAIHNKLPDQEHTFTKRYLCAWTTKSWNETKEWTEECEFHIPRYMRFSDEQKSFICGRICHMFNVRVGSSEIELIELE